jgi:hypothetical protein
VDGAAWHDGQHGFVANANQSISVQTAGKAQVVATLCQHSSEGTVTVKDANGNTVGKGFNAKVATCGTTAVVNYNGEATWLTFTFSATAYIHSIKVYNVSDFVEKDEESGWYIIPANDGVGLVLALNAASQEADGANIFLPNGTYDLGETVLTAIGGKNVSLIGESMDGVIIKNAPPVANEGLKTTATLHNTGENLYLQDLTIQNALDYYSAGSAGRGIAFWDEGKHTIAKNVKLLSYQDTYLSTVNQQFYWETSEIHGAVDFICGGSDVFFESTKIVTESRAATGKSGEATITAPQPGTQEQFGYVFNNCTIENKAASFSLGRAWGGNSTSVWLNTTMNQPKEIINTRFTLEGMNVAAYKFKEYHSLDTEGNVVSPASLVETFTKGSQSYTYDIILSDEEAAAFTLDKVFTNWSPADFTAQAPMPSFVKLEGTTLTWSENNADKMWAVLKNGNVVAFTTTASYTIDDADAQYAVRAANKMGGLSEAAAVGAYTTVTLAAPGYATFFDSENNYKIPAGLKAKVVTAATTSALTYAELTDIIPAGTAVMLESVEKTGGEYTLPITSGKAAYTGANLLKGSDVATTTTADEQSLFYKLAYGSSKDTQAGNFGWFWGAANGGAFQIEGHRAWLAVPEQQAASVRAYIIGGGGEGTTAIRNIETEDATNGEYYNLQGQRTYAPGKGIYIHNNKKVIIK